MFQLTDLTIGKRLYLLCGTLTLISIVMAITGQWAATKFERHIATVYNNRVVPAQELAEVRGLLNANRIILLRADSYSTAAAVHQARDSISSNAERISTVLKRYMESQQTPEEKGLVERFATEREAWVAAGIKPSLDALAQGNVVAARNMVLQQSDILDKALSTCSDLIALQVRAAKEEYESSLRTSVLVDWMLWGGSVLGAAIALILAIYITRSITRPVEAIGRALDRLAVERDLTVRLDVRGRDECARMATSFNESLTSLDATVRTIQHHSQELSNSATELAGAARTIREGTEAQSEAASATAASVEELAVSVSHVAENAGLATELASRSNQVASEGTSVVKSASDEMSRIADDVRASSAKAQSLAKRSNDISGIVQVIKDVADQTNLLALNAAIEAARAGEQGRGFAVVADEVRKLAERTSRSAAEITELINVVQSDTRSVVATMDESLGRVETGVQLAQKAAETLEEIRAGATSASNKISEIAMATREQSTSSNDVARHVERIAQMTEENSAAANQSAALSERLKTLSSSLHDAVAAFKTA